MRWGTWSNREMVIWVEVIWRNIGYHFRDSENLDCIESVSGTTGMSKLQKYETSRQQNGKWTVREVDREVAEGDGTGEGENVRSWGADSKLLRETWAVSLTSVLCMFILTGLDSVEAAHARFVSKWETLACIHSTTLAFLKPSTSVTHRLELCTV